MLDKVTVRTSRGDADMVGFINDAIDLATPTVGDLLYAGQRERTRILDRTAHGVDCNGAAFHPYSEKGPYYYYPGKLAKDRAGSASQMAKKLGVGDHTKGRLGIKFPSYGAFKASLGRTNVDLRGPSAPHMLQAIIVRVKSFILPGNTAGLDESSFENNEKATEITIGIYGDEAERASGHNEGNPKKNLPKRKFMGSNSMDQGEMLSDILKRSAARVRKGLKLNGN